MFKMHKDIKAPQNLMVTVAFLHGWSLSLLSDYLSDRVNTIMWYTLSDIRWWEIRLTHSPQHSDVFQNRNDVDKDKSILVLDDNVSAVDP